MTASQALWAKEHDWCVKVEHLGGGLWAVFTYCMESPRFTNFYSLRDWAGY
jgi:hypothetical protein